MEEFINSITGKLGIDSATATSAVGSLLGIIKKEGDPGTVNELLAKIPGASALASNPPAAGGGGGGGIVGKLGGMLGGLTGGGGGGLGDLAGLASSGLSPDKIPDFVKNFIDWVKQKVGPDLVNKVVGSVPALKSILG